jgi:hypothetical protein
MAVASAHKPVQEEIAERDRRRAVVIIGLIIYCIVCVIGLVAISLSQEIKDDRDLENPEGRNASANPLKETKHGVLHPGKKLDSASSTKRAA